ncbi:MAG: histidine phosphatase family protein [Planctomycetota bacterium]
MAAVQVILLRHGKAEQESPTGRDEDRPLTERGVAQSGWMGRELAEAGLSGVPVLASPAARTSHTAAIVADALGGEPAHDPRLFLSAGLTEIFDLLADGWADGVILVGHNPTLSLAASALVGGIGGRAIALRTGEAAWCETDGVPGPGSCSLRGMLRQPKT